MSFPRVFALGDPHLGSAVGKSMVRFGPHWWHHREKLLKRAWQTVHTDDILLLPGDLSWATKRREAEHDLAFLASLPGIKVAIKGNHDFWWESDHPIRFPGLLSPPQVFGSLGIAGTRGWDDSQDHLLHRERRRLERALAQIAHCPVKLAMLHYPPHRFLDLLVNAQVDACVYGHIHLGSFPQDEAMVLNGERLEGIRCWCVPCDRIDFRPAAIPL